MRISPPPYIELFARNVVAGWSAWGNELGLEDSGVGRQQPRGKVGDKDKQIWIGQKENK